MKKCLMISTKDSNLFTHEEYLPKLTEFSKIFNAQLSMVQIPDEVAPLELEQLVPAFCEKKACKAEYEIIEVKVKPKIKRVQTLNRAKKIQNIIEGNLRKGKLVTLKSLAKKFKSFGLTNACLCMHFTKIRKKLQAEGLKLIKKGGGKYKIKSKVS